jgi:outer membrane protein TolC
MMKKMLLALCCALGSAEALAGIGLDEVLEMAASKSERMQAIDLTLEALEAEMKSRDLVLSPTFTSELAAFKDKRQTASPSSNRGGTSALLDVTLEKPFSTGTKVTATVSHDALGAGPRNSTGDLNVADWNVRVSQSLWRDSFGTGTELRRAAETAEEKARRISALYEKQQFLVQVELRYWELALSLKERDIRQKNLDRSLALEKWTKSRVSQFAAEPTDLLQVQTLLSTRRLDYTTSVNDIEIAINNINAYIPGVLPTSWNLDLKSLERDRNLSDLLAQSEAEKDAKIVRMDAIAEAHRGQQLAAEAKRIDDGLKPELDIYASYGANGINERFGRSWKDASKADTPHARVGVLLSFDMDTGLKNEQRKAARLQALAQESRARGLVRESIVAWDELTRNIENLKTQVKEARSLSRLQNEKVDKERVRFEQGKTTTFQMTTFEVDAAESELRLYRLLTDLRKAEAMARIFVRDGESTL